MVIGFLGKGGSGKSTLSFRFANLLQQQNHSVLAIDADHNMDLSFNLGVETPNYFGESLPHLRRILNIAPEAHYKTAFSIHADDIFSLKPPDEFTQNFSTETATGISLMTAGPHTETIMRGDHCSHSLFTPLKLYLPFLKLTSNEYAVVDCTAGADSAGTGIPSAFSIAFICVEPTTYSIKTANQIADLLKHYGTPYEFIMNKADGGAENTVLFKQPLIALTRDTGMLSPDTTPSKENQEALFRLYQYIRSRHGSDDRKERARKHFGNKDHT